MAFSSTHNARSNWPGSAPDASAGARAARAVAVCVAYAASYVLLDLGAAAREHAAGGNVSLWYAPAAISVAVLVRFGAGYAPLYFLLAWIDNYTVWGHDIRAEPFAGLLLAGFPSAGYSLCAWVLRSRLRINAQLADLRSAAAFALAVMVTSALVAVGYTSVLGGLTRSSAVPVWHTALDFWIGDVVAILSIAPFLLTIVFPWASRFAGLVHEPGRVARIAQAARLRVADALATVLWLAVLGATVAFCAIETSQGGRAFVYPCFIPLVFAAFWRGTKGAATGMALVSVSFAIFTRPDIAHAELHDIQIFLIVLCLTSLLLGSAIASATYAARDLEQVHGVYRQAITAADAVPYVREYGSDRYAYVGDGIERITGFTAREFTPELWDDRSQTVTLHGETAGLPAEDAIRRTRSGEFRTWSSEEKFLARDGSVRWLADASVEVFGEDDKPARSIGMIQDISRIKQTEDALRASRAVLELFVEHVPAAVAMLDRDLRYIAVSKRWIEDYRLSGQDTIGQCHYDVFPEIRDNQDWIDVHQRCLRGEVEKREEDRFVRADGTEDWLRWEVRPWFDDADEIGGIFMFTEVITGRKKAEEERRALEEQMQQTQKLESLGVLAGGIAHDFNNLLVGILGNADLALADLPRDSPLCESLEAIVTSSERAAELCRQMLAYSGRGHFVVAPVSLNDVVEEMRQLLSVTVSKRVTLVFEPEPELPLVKADATQLRQIVMNLITNASEAIGDRDGVIRMMTGRLVWAGDDAGQHILGGELHESQAYAFVRVSDTGSGMDHATLQRIFDPFFTTKFTGRGLGLAAVLGIVRGHRGAIRVESEIGTGTTFTVYLPALGEGVEAVSAGVPTAPPRRGEGVVLVVDDEDSVLAIARAMLERQGFEALTAADGDEALRVFRARKDDIVLAIVDLTMPRMGGGELIHALHEIAPGLRVVLSSGYNEQEAVAQSHGETMAGFIQKPYRAREFYGTIHAALIK